MKKTPTVTRVTVNSIMNMKIFYTFCDKLEEMYPETDVSFEDKRDKANVMKRMTGFLMANIKTYTIKKDKEKLRDLIDMHQKYGISTNHLVIFVNVLICVIEDSNIISSDDLCVFKTIFSKFIYLLLSV